MKYKKYLRHLKKVKDEFYTTAPSKESYKSFSINVKKGKLAKGHVGIFSKKKLLNQKQRTTKKLIKYSVFLTAFLIFLWKVLH